MWGYRTLVWTIFIMCVTQSAFSIFLPTADDTGVSAVKKAPRFLSWLWFGIQCNGCPPHSCEDDEAIIHGYCCGCAYSLDRLPVICPQFLQCPLNVHGLCHDYEYMIRCCC